ncbi:hypothetical protein [Chloroflexus sp.]|uniref:hypothetical protein n=1 Tax=Chloroflexus sp. TaxID=1904827 RepID=UPI00298EE8ED|nr:hypothetical protein [Chloroflexus sp.]MDW8405071.1 hypothetical protein [Chloroflexus sp.]
MSIQGEMIRSEHLQTAIKARLWHPETIYSTIFITSIIIIASFPTIFAYVTAPEDRFFTGVVYNIPDHNQYFAWLRDFRYQHLAANRLTAEPNEPALFHLLWWISGKAGVIFDLSFGAIFNILRIIGGITLLISGYLLFRVTIANEVQRKLAFTLFATGGGLGIVWVIIKHAQKLEDAPFPFDIYTSEPNSFFLVLAFPHFALALSLIIGVIGFTFVAYQRQQLRYAIVAGICGFLIGLQHAYDILTLAAVLGIFGLLVWWRDRQFPTFLFKCGIIIAAFTVPPGAYLSWLVLNDATWGGKLAQFDNAGAWTPNLFHLPILLGVPFLLALASFRLKMLRSQDNAELLFAAWFVVHFVLAYLPVSFQIHLLLGWQVPIAVLAARLIHTRIWPWIRQRFGSIGVVTATVAILGLSMITNVYLVVWRIVDLGRYQQPYFLTSDEVKALEWLATHTTKNDVVLGVLEINQHVPPWTDAHAFLAHWAGTLDYYVKIDMVAKVLDPNTPSAERTAILDMYNVRYVIVREQDVEREQFSAAAGEVLTPVFTQGAVTIYRRQ